ncbi:membrane dipeptidase [Mesorhizobium sp. WSM3224]|uniref:dipeptidase n=1 Tax=Mesorhizobium sp. WSM3224 TaxID=1040986 RepID=UPI00047F0370|nr:membrane dipeptidase [Mesorhizobium sp. WSM3224]
MISDTTQSFWNNNIIWDMLFPIDGPTEKYGCPPKYLQHYVDAGVSFTAIDFAGDGGNLDDAVKVIASQRQLIQSQPHLLIHALTIDDVTRAKIEGKLAIGMQTHGTAWFGKNIGVLEVFRELGLRVVQLVFNTSNFVGGGCADQADGGLTTYGVHVVRELERLKMVVDLAHTGYRTTLEVMNMAEKPVIFSHIGIMALHQHYRNLRDDQILALAKNGGVIGLSGNNAYIGDEYGAMSAIFKHLDHVVQLVGPDHVGFGFDFVFETDVLNKWAEAATREFPAPKDPNWKGYRFQRPKDVINLVQLMFDHGYPEEAVKKIVSGNFMRVCKEIW